MTTPQALRRALKPGSVYRRSYLARRSPKQTDALLARLCREGALKKIRQGLYYRPALTPFGETFPKEHLLLKSFLKCDRFLCVTPNDYNALGVGTTQLYNMTFVYNGKRNGVFEFCGRRYRFIKRLDFPRWASREFLLVDLLNNLKLLAEDEAQVKESVAARLSGLDHKALKRAAKRYGKVGTKRFLMELLDVSSRAPAVQDAP